MFVLLPTARKNAVCPTHSALLSHSKWVKEQRRRRRRRKRGGKASLLSLKSMEANDRAVVSTVGCNDHEMRSLCSHYSVPQIYKKLLEGIMVYIKM